MTTSTLTLPVSGEQDLAGWAAVAVVASYSSPGTPQAYTTQLRLWFDWCAQHQLEPLADVRRPHVELYARDLETRNLAPATVALKLVVLTGFYAASRSNWSNTPDGARPPAEGLTGVDQARTRPHRARCGPRPGGAIRRR